jgi:hypothetical protein
LIATVPEQERKKEYFAQSPLDYSKSDHRRSMADMAFSLCDQEAWYKMKLGTNAAHGVCGINAH